MGYPLYREIRDLAPASWTSGERLVALMIADDANDTTRRGWIPNELLCRRTGLTPSGLKTALQRLAARGYELRVSHGADSLGRPVYAVRGHRTEYHVPDVTHLLGDAATSPLPVEKPEERGRHSIANPGRKATLQHRNGDAVASHGDAAASPLSSGLLTISPMPNDLDLAGPVESTGPPPGQDHESRASAGHARRDMTPIERAAWAAAIGARK